MSDKNPNRVKRDEVDDVFMATAGEIMYRRGKAKRDRKQLRDANLETAKKIVDKANKKKGKS